MKLRRRIVALGAAFVMAVSASAVGANAYSSSNTYSSATWSISASSSQSSKSTTKTLKAGNKVTVNGKSKNVIIVSWTDYDEVLYSYITFTSPNGSDTVTIDSCDYYEYFTTMTDSYRAKEQVKCKITLHNGDEDDIKASGYARTPK